MIKMAKKITGIRSGRKRADDQEDPLYEISRCNSYDFGDGMTRQYDLDFSHFQLQGQYYQILHFGFYQDIER